MSCLFRSIGYFLNKNQDEVRSKICDYLDNNGEIIKGVNTKDLIKFENKNYIQNMRKSNTQGGGIEIQCACNIWNLKIIVVNIRDSKQKKNIDFFPIDSNKINKIIKITWNGGHYEPLK